MVELLIENGADANGRTINGTTVMIEAIQKGKADLAIKLIHSGADVNAWDLTGQAAIIPALKDIKAPSEKKLELVETLLKAGADVHATTVGWSTPCIWLAVESGSMDMTELMLKHGANPSAMRQDVTLLVYAVDKDETALAKLLIRHGADINMADKKGRTPVVMAILRQNVDMLTLLVANGASADLKDQQPSAELSKGLANAEIAAVLGMTLAPRPSQVPRRLTKTSSG
jgi:ankyrin repeat protein